MRVDMGSGRQLALIKRSYFSSYTNTILLELYRPSANSHTKHNIQFQYASKESILNAVFPVY
jgi:hypothetical protein